MPIYTDSTVLNMKPHPGLTVDPNHPTVKMRRKAVKGKSVFIVNEEDALALARYYLDDYHNDNVYDEFGTQIWDFKTILKDSYYMKTAKTVSKFTFQELLDAYRVEKKLLESIQNEKEEKDAN